MNISLVGYLLNSSYADLKSKRVIGISREYSFSKKKELSDHLAMIEREFIGRTELSLLHAVLSVMIRRKIDLEKNIAKFLELWTINCDDLIVDLDSKWLKSACDTLLDYSPTIEDRLFALSGTLFANTCKAYETELFALESKGNYKDIEGRIDLYDGIFAFSIGRGDMIGNLFRRTRTEISKNPNSIGAKILTEMLNRAVENNTVFKRFRELHQNPKTLW